jgi:hypothetical protein
MRSPGNRANAKKSNIKKERDVQDDGASIQTQAVAAPLLMSIRHTGAALPPQTPPSGHERACGKSQKNALKSASRRQAADSSFPLDFQPLRAIGSTRTKQGRRQQEMH